MAFDLSSLSSYVEEKKLDLISKTLIGGKFMEIHNLQTGVVGPTAINLIEQDTIFGDGSTCGFTASGSTTLTQRIITPGYIKVNKSYCDKDFLNYYQNYEVKLAAGKETLPFESKITETEIDKIIELKEIALVQGDTDSLNANLNKFDGLIKIIDGVSGSTIAADNSGITSITVSNVMTVINNVYSKLPSKFLGKEGVAIVCGADVYKLYTQALTSANLYHYNAEQGKDGEMIIPGTSVRLIALHGLNTTNRVFGYKLDNVYVGTDMQNDSETFDMWFSKDNDEFRLKASFGIGVQVAFPDEIVSFKLSE